MSSTHAPNDMRALAALSPAQEDVLIEKAMRIGGYLLGALSSKAHQRSAASSN
jgi:hypothetical protein